MTAAPLAGKTAFVTGGSGGIGSACAEALVRDGAAALLMGRRAGALESTRKGILERCPGATVVIHAGDARKKEGVVAALDDGHAPHRHKPANLRLDPEFGDLVPDRRVFGGNDEGNSRRSDCP